MPILPEHLPGERLVMKIWETVTEKGIGGLLSPWQIKREGKARAEVRRHELLLEEQARQELEQIRTGQKVLDTRGRLIDANPTGASTPVIRIEEQTAPPGPPADAQALLTYALQQGAIREAQRMLTLRRIAAYAEEEAEDTPDEAISGDPIDPDWFARWRRNAEDANDELLKRLWARVLAGEVKQPKSFSFRTLDFLRNVSVDEANLIQKLAPFVIDSDFVYREGNEFLNRRGFTFSVMLDMQNLGIISGAEAIGITLTLVNRSTDATSFLSALRCHDKLLWITAEDPKKEVSLSGFAVTRVGKEIFSLGKFVADVDYLGWVGKKIKDMGCSVRLGDCEIVSNGVRLRNPVEL